MLGPAANGQVRPAAYSTVLVLLGPALLVVLLLFGGGLILGVFQAMGFDSEPLGPDRGLAQFRAVIADADFGPSLVLTLTIAGVATLLATAGSIPLALILVRLGRRGRLAGFLLQIPLTVPHLVIAVASLFLLAPTGLLARGAASLGLIPAGQFPLLVNDPGAVAILFVYVWKEIPFITFMLMSVLQNSGAELDEVGQTLKANAWQRFRYITLPIIMPSLGAAMLIVFAYTFGAFEVPYLLGQTYPMSLPVWAYRLYSDVDLLARPQGIAVGLLIALIVVFAVVAAHLLLNLARRRGLRP